MTTLKEMPVGNDKFITRYAHSFNDNKGNVFIFDGIPTHATEDECCTCPTPGLIAAMSGAEDNGPIAVKVLKENHSFMLTAGITSPVETQAGHPIAIAGPAIDKAKARMAAEGTHIPDADNENDQKEAWERYQKGEEMASLQEEPQAPTVH